MNVTTCCLIGSQGALHRIYVPGTYTAQWWALRPVPHFFEPQLYVEHVSVITDVLGNEVKSTCRS
jgi:hypothetical protein